MPIMQKYKEVLNMDERKPSFIERMLVSVATGAACGALSGKADVDLQQNQQFTDMMIDLAFIGQDAWKHRNRNGYFNPDDPYKR